jgi:hypothetical protein
MKYLIVLILLSLAACNTTGEKPETPTRDVKTMCINGVEYYTFKEYLGISYRGFGFMAVKWNPDGTLSLCDY